MMKKSSCDIFSNVTKWQQHLQSTDEIVEILYSCFTKWASSVHEQASVYPSCTHLPSSQKLILSVRAGNEKFVMKLSGTALLASHTYSKKERTLTLHTLFCETMYIKHTWHLCLNLFHHVPSPSSPNHVACLHTGSVQFTTFLEIFSYLFSYLSVKHKRTVSLTTVTTTPCSTLTIEALQSAQTFFHVSPAYREIFPICDDSAVYRNTDSWETAVEHSQEGSLTSKGASRQGLQNTKAFASSRRAPARQRLASLSFRFLQYHREELCKSVKAVHLPVS